MQFDAKFFTLLVFIVINFLILFVVKTRTSLVISVIIAHLIAVLFFSLSIANYNSFREVTLALIVYSMVILFLISNYGLIVVEADKKSKSKKRNLLLSVVIYFVACVVFLLIFLVVKDVSEMREIPVVVQEQEVQAPNSDSIKKARMRDKLLDNFLLKRSSDVILIMVAASTVLLLLSRKEK